MPGPGVCPSLCGLRRCRPLGVVLGSSPCWGRPRTAGCQQHPRPPPTGCHWHAPRPPQCDSQRCPRRGHVPWGRGYPLWDALYGQGAALSCPSHSEGQTRRRGLVALHRPPLPVAGLVGPCPGPQRAQDPYLSPFIATRIQVHTPGSGLVSRHTELLGGDRIPRSCWVLDWHPWYLGLSPPWVAPEVGPGHRPSPQPALVGTSRAADGQRADCFAALGRGCMSHGGLSEPHFASLGNGVATAPVSGFSHSGGGRHST